MGSPGLSFKKLDLHIHTPASQDFHDRNVTPEQIVEKAIAKGLDAIAITDHNSGAWIDRVKTAASKKGLVIFPGVEISCRDGTSGIHLIALFDVDKTSTHVEGLLEKLDITSEKQGKTESLVSKQLAITQVIDIIQSELRQGIAIPAHVSSSKGILQDIRGNPRKDVVQHPGLIAVESPDFQNEEKKKKKKRTVDLLDGNDPYYQVKLAVYQASDNPSGTDKCGHGLDGIGSRCAYFKMEKINLESLRQCFLDPDVRIRQDFEFEHFEYPRIASLSIRKGFFEGETAKFNDGLNSILGGKGTGKSLLVELLRFGLNQPPEHNEIRMDHENKLKHRLGEFGVVEVEFVDEIRRVFKPIRTFDPSSIGYEEIGYDPSQVLQVLFLSQNEIIRIAEDETLQLRFIDRFFPSNLFEEKIQVLEATLHNLDTRIADGLRAVDEVAELRESIATIQIEISRLDAKLDAPIFRQYADADEKCQVIRGHYDHLKDIQQSTVDYREQVDSLVVTDVPLAYADDAVLTANKARLDEAKEYVDKQIKGIVNKLAEVESLLTADKAELGQSFKQIRAEHLEYIGGEGGDHAKLTSEREQLSQRKNRLDSRLETQLQVADSVAKVPKERELKLNELDEVYNDWHNERMERCKHFEASSEGKLRLNILGLSDKQDFRSRLLELKRGSNIRDKDIEKIASADQPRSFVQSLLDYLAGRTTTSLEETAPLEEIARKADLPLERVAKLAGFLLSRDDLEQLLELQYKAHPKDRPEIRFDIGTDKYELLKFISVGQKCTALLIMALSDGQMPVVIDQPEDSLDIRSIWEDICSKVRVNKTQRQFIFTTHNSSVAVASDSDNYIILEADSNHGRIVHKGSMDHSPVSDEVLRYMEGGMDAYRKKFTKYRADDRLSKH